MQWVNYVSIYAIMVMQNRFCYLIKGYEINILHTWWINNNGYDDILTPPHPCRNLAIKAPLDTSGDTSLACR
jgi:hypothetical protein